MTGKNPERDAENARKLGWARDEYARGGLTDTQLYKQERELGKKDDPDFMTKLIDSLTDSAREGAGKIQDILGTRMYDFVSDKFNKMGLSFLNSVAKMVSSAASAKLMDLMFGDFTKGGPLGGLLGDIGGFFGDIGNSVMGLFGFGSQPVAQAFPVKFATGGAFTNGIVSRATAFPMGLMGEAGPEAVMPLHRGADGSLGIRASFAGLPQDSDAGTGAGGVAVNVYVQDGNVSASSDSGEPGWKQFGQQIGEYVTQLVDRRMSQSYRQGGLAGRPATTVWEPEHGIRSLQLVASAQSRRRVQDRTLRVQFGDGYEQEAADGIHTVTQSWPLQFVGNEVYVRPILDFVRRHAGGKSSCGRRRWARRAATRRARCRCSPWARTCTPSRSRSKSPWPLKRAPADPVGRAQFRDADGV